MNRNHRFEYGKRYISIIHARIRNGCSDLNFDMYNNQLRDNPYCICSESIETAEHFFFTCNMYTNIRQNLFHSTRLFHPLSIELLLVGSDQLSYNDNVLIIDAVHSFIKASKRFS